VHDPSTGYAGWGGQVLNGAVTISGATLSGNAAAALVVESGSVMLDDVTILGMPRSHAGPMFLVGVFGGAALNGEDVVAMDADGPAYFVADGALLDCRGCSVNGAVFAGVASLGGQIVLEDSDIAGVVPDEDLDGGLAIVAANEGGPEPSAEVSGGTLIGGGLGAVLVEGQGRYRLDDAALSGSGGLGVVALDGVGAWDGSSGLRLAGNAFSDCSTAVLLDGATATLAGNNWPGASPDIRQQSCDGVPQLDLSQEPSAVAQICSGADIVVPSLLDAVQALRSGHTQ
jgi:hypothetical protein